jgi:protein gp37
MTKIEWCDLTINPISGCLHGCPFCYARSFAKRHAGNERKHPGSTGYPTTGDPCRPYFHPNRIDQILNIGGRSKLIFLDSMSDWFSPGVKPEWLDIVIGAVRQNPEHTFLVLTKWPDRIDLKDVPPNLWLGVSITKQEDAWRLDSLGEKVDGHKFVSIEPLHGSIEADLGGIEWVIVGAETGNRKGRIEPRREWVEGIREEVNRLGMPLFLKNNIQKYYGESVRDYPTCMMR